VLLTVGRRFDLDQLDAIPHNVHVEPWVNQPDVLAEADVVVCHGGSGTTFGALAAGVPLVIAPMFADQFANGAKVAASGAGVTLGSGAAGGRRRPLSWADGSPLAQAIETLAAHQIATEMASAPTIDELLMDLLAQ